MAVVRSEGTVDAVAELGIANDGSVDVTDQITHALQQYQRVYLPAGNYLIGGGAIGPEGGIALYLTGDTPFHQHSRTNGHRLCGAGPNATFLTVANDRAAGISVYPNTSPRTLASCSLGDFTITRRGGSPRPGAFGLVVYGGAAPNVVSYSNQILLYNITSELHLHGFVLGPTLFSAARNCIAQNNYSTGFYLTNRADSGPFARFNHAAANPLQWELIDCASQNNCHPDNPASGGFGFAAHAFPATAGGPVTLHPWSNLYTNNNPAGGIAINAASAAAAIGDFTIVGGWIDQDGGSLLVPPGNGNGIWLNTNGGGHRIINTHIEFSAAHGILIDGLSGSIANADVHISGTSVFSCGKSGIAATGPAAFSFPSAAGGSITFQSEVQVGNCRITNNSWKVPGHAGIDFANPRVAPTPYQGGASVVGCRIGNDTTSTPPGQIGAQHAGLTLASPGGVPANFVAACDLRGNGPGGPYAGTPAAGSGTNRL